MTRPWTRLPDFLAQSRLTCLVARLLIASLVTTTSLAATVTYTYDVHGRATTRTMTSGVGDNTTVTNTFDNANNLTSVVTTSVDPIVPATPTGLSASVISATKINLAWNAASDGGGSGLAGYRIRRNGTVIATVAATSYSDTGVVGSTTYNYSVAAYDNQGNESAFATVSASTPDITAPSTPTGLTGYAVDYSWVNLSWSASTDTGGSGLAGYEIFRGGSLLGSSTTTSYADHTTAANTAYSYTVKAKDGANNRSPASAAFPITTPNAPDLTPPSVPAGLSGSSPVTGTINLSWSASTDPAGGTGVAGYRVQRGPLNGATSYLATTTGTSFQNTGLTCGVTYGYQVQAFDGANNSSALSGVVNVKVADTVSPAAPTGLGASSSASNHAFFSWSAASDPCSGIGGYNVYRNDQYVVTTGGTGYNDYALTPNTYYRYRVQAYDAASTPNLSTLSAEIGVTTLPSAPGSATFDLNIGSSVRATWSASSDANAASGYRYSLNGSTWTETAGRQVTLTGLTRATTYTLYVQAKGSTGLWSASTTTAFTTATYYTDTFSLTTGSVFQSDGQTSTTITGYNAGGGIGSISGATLAGGGTIRVFVTVESWYLDWNYEWQFTYSTSIQVEGLGSVGQDWLRGFAASDSNLGMTATSFGCSSVCMWSWNYSTGFGPLSGTNTILHK